MEKTNKPKASKTKKTKVKKSKNNFIYDCFDGGPESRRYDGAVYIGDGVWIYPDGYMEDESDD